jgi:hypothetical protein
MSLKKQYRDLETKVLNALRTAIEKSGGKLELKENTHEYLRYAIIRNDKVVLLDELGYEYSYFLLDLEQLIDQL